MRSFIVFSFILIAYLPLVSQDFKGVVVYQTESLLKVSFAKPKAADQKDTLKVSAEEKALNEKIRKSMQKEYELVFNKTESIYREIEELKDIKEEGGVEIIGLGGGTDGGLYKNTKDKIFKESRDVFGKLFLVDDQLQGYNWKLEKETKKIGHYTCYKASATKTKVKTKKVIEEGVEKEIRKVIETPITAWYTPEIPLAQGPSEYWGLPGLILEAQDSKMKMTCVKIMINPEDTIEIKMPKKGKKVNQAEFKEIYNKKVMEMASMYQSKRKKSE